MASVQKDYTATGTSDEVSLIGGQFSIDGTFVGTVQLQRYLNGGWRTVRTLTAQDELVIDERIPTRYRSECTAYTSGTIETELIGTISK